MHFMWLRLKKKWSWPKNNNEKYWNWQIRIDIWLIARIQFRIIFNPYTLKTHHNITAQETETKRSKTEIIIFCSLRIIIIDDRLGKYHNIHIRARAETNHIVNGLHNLFVCAFNWALNQWSINIDLYKSHRLFSTSSSSPFPASDCECERIRYSSLERCSFRFEWINPHLPFFIFIFNAYDLAFYYYYYYLERFNEWKCLTIYHSTTRCTIWIWVKET